MAGAPGALGSPVIFRSWGEMGCQSSPAEVRGRKNAAEAAKMVAKNTALRVKRRSTCLWVCSSVTIDLRGEAQSGLDRPGRAEMRLQTTLLGVNRALGMLGSTCVTCAAGQ